MKYCFIFVDSKHWEYVKRGWIWFVNVGIQYSCIYLKKCTFILTAKNAKQNWRKENEDFEDNYLFYI